MNVTASASGLELHHRGGPRVALGLVGSKHGWPRAVGSDVVYPGGTESKLIARATEEGAQILIIVEGPGAPHEFRFPMTVDGGRAHLDHDGVGGVLVRASASSPPLASISTPWARDATGHPVATRFAIEGNVLVQTVDHRDSDYPVIADPNTCGWVTCTYYFNKSQTRDIASAGAGLAACGVMAMMGTVGAVLGGVCTTFAAAAVVQANRAKNRGMCLKIKYPRTGVGLRYPDIYKGGHCR